MCPARRHLSPTSHWWRHQLGWWQPHTKSRDQEVQGGASILKPTPRLNHRLPQSSRATKLTPLSKVPALELPPPSSSSKLIFKESSSRGIFSQLRSKSWVELKSAKWEVRRMSSPQEKVVDAVMRKKMGKKKTQKESEHQGLATFSPQLQMLTT